eukprot:8215181-Pyramimonas_sp.AAC.1
MPCRCSSPSWAKQSASTFIMVVSERATTSLHWPVLKAELTRKPFTRIAISVGSDIPSIFAF